MNAARAFAVSSLAIAGFAWGSPARAQTDYEAVVRLMGECARIAEIEARVACYDKTMEAARLIASVPGAQANPAPTAPAERRPTGFGGESLRERATVRAARRTEPGIYLLTLDDGAQWRFVEAVPPSYDPPRTGTEIELRRGSLGSFLMRYADQRSVRVQRVQ